MLTSSYFPHALYSVAITSISIHLVSQRKNASDEQARMEARISILESIAQQLRSDAPLSTDELNRLKRLARPPPEDISNEEIGWKEVVFGQKKKGHVPEMSEWDKKDIEKVQKALGELS